MMHSLHGVIVVWDRGRLTQQYWPSGQKVQDFALVVGPEQVQQVAQLEYSLADKLL